ncbi:MAG TPA: CoA transferase [Solirubrobacteraceae bacterium]|nr:CoA transferase [Solirubrobacteraceae bacterium]
MLVADFSRVLAGPIATQTLADLGADVVKVERPDGGDDTRGWGPSYFLGLNRGKRSVALDLKDPGDAALARELVARADVAVESFRPGVWDRFDLGRPKRVSCHVTAFGANDLPGYDLLLQAVSGLMHVTGEEDGRPLKVGSAVIDLVCGLHAALGILAALREDGYRRVEVSLMDSALVSLLNQASAYLNEGVSPRRMGNRHPSIAPYETFGELAVACGNDAMFVRLCEVVGRPDLAERFPTNLERLEHRDEISAALEAAFARDGDWVARLNAAGVPAGPINDVPAAFAFAESLGLDPVWELDGVKSVRSPLRGLARPTSRPPRLDEHGDEIRRWLRAPA